MKRWLKHSLVGALGLTLAAAATLGIAAHLGERKSQRLIAVEVARLPPASGPASIERGRYLFMSRGCTECHGSNGAGKDVMKDAKGLLIHAPNITPAPGSVVASYRPEDWVRTIRHGVKPSGRPALIMPSEDYNRLTDDDLAALVAFLRQMPPVAGEGATVRLPAMLRALYGVGAIRDAAEKIDHTLPPQTTVAEAVTPAHGAYVANMCIGCHGAALAGGKIPGAPPDWPAAANLTPGPGSAMPHYPDAAAFARMLRTGLRPDGSAVSQVMPFGALREMNDTDVEALYLHLRSLKPLEPGARG